MGNVEAYQPPNNGRRRGYPKALVRFVIGFIVFWCIVCIALAWNFFHSASNNVTDKDTVTITVVDTRPGSIIIGKVNGHRETFMVRPDGQAQHTIAELTDGRTCTVDVYGKSSSNTLRAITNPRDCND